MLMLYILLKPTKGKSTIANVDNLELIEWKDVSKMKDVYTDFDYIRSLKGNRILDIDYIKVK
jgi:hypothetical protein